MNNRAILIPVTGDTKEITPRNGTDFQLDELYQLLATDIIQVVPLEGDWIMIIDEEGKLKPHESNPRATIRATTIAPTDYIAGDAIVCPTEMLL